ncbi:hypothetical protein CHUAL_000507 [Chamberlinius hualienensis]
MTSKIGVKTYARQKMVCQPSSIQFDQLLDDKGNKPCAAKSKGTLHRWGMTSFTSLRNSSMNGGGRKEKTTSSVTVETKKRKPEPAAESNDPFSFDFESDNKKKTFNKDNKFTASAAESLNSKNLPPPPVKTNKFFKSGSSRFGGSRSTSTNVSAPLLGTSNIVKQNVYFETSPIVKSNPVVARDAFAELLLSAEVPGVTGVASAETEMCLNSYPEEAAEVAASNLFPTYPPQTVRTYSGVPANIITHTYSYDQNFYHQQPTQDVNVIQNQVLFPVSTIPQAVVQPEVIFPCPVIQSRPPPSSSTEFAPQTQMPILGNDLALGLTNNQTNVNVIDNSRLADNTNINVAVDSYSKPSFDEVSAEDDLFDSIRKTASTYTSYNLQQEMKTTDPVYHEVNALSESKVGQEIKQDELLDHFSSNDSFMVMNPDQPENDVQSTTQMPSKDVFPSTVMSLTDTSIPKNDAWPISDQEAAMLDQPLVPTTCETNTILNETQEMLDSKLLVDNMQSQPLDTAPVETVKKEWDLFSTRNNVCDANNEQSSSSNPVTTTAILPREPSKSLNVAPLKSETKSWELPYEPLMKRHTFSGSSKFSFAHRRIFNTPKKMDRKAVYKHRPWQAEEEENKEETAVETSKSSIVDEFDEFENDGAAEKPVLHRVVTWPTTGSIDDEAVTSVKCEKRFRDYYTVVRNVKQAHQCHESGETQEYNDDVEYLLESLQDSNSIGTRCLSLLSLASKCMAPAFRMHLRAHGALTKVFSALHDAPKQPNLALCTATVLFVLSQDRLNMDLERSSLDLMLQLLDTDTNMMDVTSFGDTSNRRDRELDKNKEKVVDLCDELQKKGYAKHIDLDNITAAVLAMESLLSLTSKRAGEWFKEELRELGGLEHLVNTVSECGKCLPPILVQLTDYALDKLRKLDRCLRVLENVTVMNSENQYYLINCQDSALIYYCARALQLCESCLKVYPTPDSSDRESASWTLFSCLLSAMKVLLNLTNENCNGSAKVGEQEGLINSLLSCVLHLPSHLTPEQRFDMHVLSLGLLINLVEYCENNRKRLFFAEVSSSNATHSRRCNGTIPAPKALVNLFLEHEDAARVEEAKTDKLLDGKGDQDNDGCVNSDGSTTAAPSTVDDIEETLKKALQKAGKNMEDSMIAAYIALLLGCIIQNNQESASRVRDHLPSKSFDGMVQMLNKFLNFMTLTDIVGSTGMKSIKRVIDILENS